MYIFFRNCYLRNLRSTDLVRNRRCHHHIRTSLATNKKHLQKYSKYSHFPPEFPLLRSVRSGNCLTKYNPLLLSKDTPGLSGSSYADNLIDTHRISRTVYRADKEHLKSCLTTYNPLLHSTYTTGLFNSSYADNLIGTRQISISAYRAEKEPLKPSSKVEVTVQALKDEQKNKESLPVEKKEPKKSLKQRIVDELVHYYHGFRLLFIDIKISCGLMWRILKGKSLTRREHNLLVRTVGDLFRLVPFSVFVIVPFLEFTLPIFLKLFPGMLPSTFTTAKEREDKLKQNLKVKLEMAKFLQKTLDDMAVQHKDRVSSSAKEFAQWFHKVRTSGEDVSNEDIMKFSKLFQDELTLDSLSRGQLVALCRVLEVQTLGTSNLLRFQLRMKLRSLAADDKLIQKEGVDTLTVTELQNACKARGMRAYGLSEDMLRRQLSKWLDLSLNKKVPPSLLLLSRSLMLPETIPTTDKLKATISVLPDTIVTHTTAAIAEQEGKIDNRMKLEAIKEEARKVKEERQEQREERKRKEKETLIDSAPNIDDTLVCKPVSIEELKSSGQISSQDIEVLEDALDSVAKHKLILEKESIEDLKEEMADYQEDVQELKEVTSKAEIKESIAAKRLFNKVNKMIMKMDGVVAELENKEKKMKKELAGGESKVTQEDIVRIDELLDAIKKMQKVPNEHVLEQIQNMLGKMDDDHDGSIKVEDVLKVIEVIGKENVQLNTKQVDDIIELIDKEEILEVEDKIEKALQKDAEKKATKKSSQDVTQQLDSKSGKSTKIDAQTSSLPTPPLNSIDQTKKGGDSKTL